MSSWPKSWLMFFLSWLSLWPGKSFPAFQIQRCKKLCEKLSSLCASRNPEAVRKKSLSPSKKCFELLCEYPRGCCLKRVPQISRNGIYNKKPFLSRQILYSHFITHLQVQLVPIPSVETGHAAVDTFSPNLPERYWGWSKTYCTTLPSTLHKSKQRGDIVCSHTAK